MSAKKKSATPTRKKTTPEAAAVSRSFRAKVVPEGEIFEVKLPFDVKEVFGKARPPIVITVNDYSFRSTVMVYGGESFIGIRRSHREAAGLVPGRQVSITLTLDTAPRVVDPPPDLAKLLSKNATARAAWEALSFTHKLEHVEAILDAKKPETRARRLEKTIQMLTSR